MDDPGIGEDVAGKRVFVSVNGVGVPGECVGVPVNIEGVSVNNMGVPVECVGVPVNNVGVSVNNIGVIVECVGVPVESVGVPVKNVGVPDWPVDCVLEPSIVVL